MFIIKKNFKYTQIIEIGNVSFSSPTMMGCVFAMQREYFFHMGGFDEGMDIWGGENIELPLRVSDFYYQIKQIRTF